jgi:DNA repair photolyase
MDYRLITCNSLIKKITSKDLLFNGNYTIDPYQNCDFECKYCDSSLEKIIYIKINADQILEREIKNLKKGVVILGSVNDPYQKSEEKYEISKKLLKILKKYDFPCHILTKSNLIIRDINLLKDMNCTVTISISSLNSNITKIFEKNVPSVLKRMETLKFLVKNGIKAGIALIPIIPYIVDEEIEKIIKKSKQNNAQFFLYKHLELKGDQKIAFMNIIQTKYPKLVSRFENSYKDSFNINKEIKSNYEKKIHKICDYYKISEKIDNI